MGLLQLLGIKKNTELGNVAVTVSFDEKVLEAVDSISIEEIQKRVTEQFAREIYYSLEPTEFIRRIQDQMLKTIDLTTIKERLNADLVNNTEAHQRIVNAVVENVEWYHKDKIIEGIDWTQLTPILTALATKELANKVFRGYR